MRRNYIAYLYLLVVAGLFWAIYWATPYSPADQSLLAPLGRWYATRVPLLPWADLGQAIVGQWRQGDTSLAPTLTLFVGAALPRWAIGLITTGAIMLIVNQLLHLAGFSFRQLAPTVLTVGAVVACLPWGAGLWSVGPAIAVVWSTALTLTAVRAFYADKRRKGLRWWLLALAGGWLSPWAAMPIWIALVVRGCQVRWRWRWRQWCIFTGLLMGSLMVIVPGIVLHAPIALSALVGSPWRWLYHLWHDCYLLIASALALAVVMLSQAGRWALCRVRGTAFATLLLAAVVGWVAACLFDFDPLLPAAMTTNYSQQALFAADSSLWQAVRTLGTINVRLGGVLFWYPQLYALGSLAVLLGAFNRGRVPAGAGAIVAFALCALLAVATIWLLALTLLGHVA